MIPWKSLLLAINALALAVSWGCNGSGATAPGAVETGPTLTTAEQLATLRADPKTNARSTFAAVVFATTRAGLPPVATWTPRPVSTPQPYTYSPDTFDAKLASCGSAPIGTTEYVVNTTRRFVTIPRAVYPDGQFVEVSGSAFAGYISNGGMPGHAIAGSIECWSTYYEFGGAGEVDFVARSVVPGAPDYTLHYVVEPRESCVRCDSLRPQPE